MDRVVAMEQLKNNKGGVVLVIWNECSYTYTLRFKHYKLVSKAKAAFSSGCFYYCLSRSAALSLSMSLSLFRYLLVLFLVVHFAALHHNE